MKVFKNLWLTFLVSTALGFVASGIYCFAFKQHGHHSYQAFVLAEVAAFVVVYSNLALFVSALPALALRYAVLWHSVAARLFLYFCGPLLFTAAVIKTQLSVDFGICYLLCCIIFLIVHFVFHVKTVMHHFRQFEQPAK
jgi:hypothetical protein